MKRNFHLRHADLAPADRVIHRISEPKSILGRETERLPEHQDRGLACFGRGIAGHLRCVISTIFASIPPDTHSRGMEQWTHRPQ